MGLSTRTQNALLAALCAAAVGTSAYAVWTVHQPHPSLQESATEQPAPVAPAEPPDDVAVTSAATSTPPPPPEPTEEASTSSADETVEPTVDNWLQAWDGDGANLLIIGDGYTNSTSQWVQAWAGHLAQDRPVQIHHWGEAEDRRFNDPIVLSDGDKDDLTVWSAGRRGSTIADAADHVDRFLDAAPTPDAVLITMGLGSANEDVPESMDALIDGLDEGVLVLVAIGPAGLYESQVSDALSDWAQEHDDRVALIDVRERAPAQPNAEIWAQAFANALTQAAR